MTFVAVAIFAIIAVALVYMLVNQRATDLGSGADRDRPAAGAAQAPARASKDGARTGQ
jgi:hypothetical protein